MTTSSPDPHRWVKLHEIAERYGIPQSKVDTLLQRGAWHCHRYPGMIRFSPEDQADIEEKWQKYRGEDPYHYTPSWIEIAMKDEPTAREREAVKRGYEASEYLRSIEEGR